jgi:hypothetical protein
VDPSKTLVLAVHDAGGMESPDFQVGGTSDLVTRKLSCLWVDGGPACMHVLFGGGVFGGGVMCRATTVAFTSCTRPAMYPADHGFWPKHGVVWPVSGWCMCRTCCWLQQGVGSLALPSRVALTPGTTEILSHLRLAAMLHAPCLPHPASPPAGPVDGSAVHLHAGRLPPHSLCRHRPAQPVASSRVSQPTAVQDGAGSSTTGVACLSA